MKDLAILVDNKNDSTEAQDLLFSMGYKWRGLGENSKSYFYPKMNKYFIFMNKNEMDLQMAGYYAGSSRSYAESRFKETTIPELRDLVVLKRNDVEDANYKTNCGTQCYITGEDVYAFQDNKWFLSAMQYKDILDMIKPIEKPMKEYLAKTQDGKYHYINDSYVECPQYVEKIEIPEGTIKATLCNDFLIFWKDDFLSLSGKNGDTDFTFNKDEDYGFVEYMNINEDAVIIWQRQTHPEELPFVDDEPKPKRKTISVSVPVNNPAIGTKWIDELSGNSPFDTQIGGSHYKNLKIQPMQYALENKLDYAQANVVKYVTRHKEKNGKEDLLKAIHNIELMIKFYYGDEK